MTGKVRSHFENATLPPVSVVVSILNVFQHGENDFKYCTSITRHFHSCAILHPRVRMNTAALTVYLPGMDTRSC